MTTSSPLVVAQITDTHLFAEADRQMLGCSTVQTFEAVLQQVKQAKPDRLLLTGDLSQDETIASYERLRDALQPLDIPASWIPGNHDRPELMEAVFSEAPFSADQSFQLGHWRLLLLTSSIPHQVQGRLSDDSLQWLEQQLQQFADQPTLVALHHPPVLIHSAWMDQIGLENSAALMAVIDRHPQVKLVVFGHIHQAFEQQRQGVTFLGSPSTCVQFVPGQEQMVIDAQAPGFRLLYLYPDGSYSTTIERARDLAE